MNTTNPGTAPDPAAYETTAQDTARTSRVQRSAADTLFVPIALAIFGLAVMLRVYHLDYLPLWNDELFSRYYYDLFGAKFLVTTGLTLEPTPPLYYFMLEPWMTLFGHSEAALRSLSVVASLVALPLVYAVARELFGRTSIALAAAALFAVSPMAVYFSQEARVYMFTLIPAGMMLLGIARYLRQQRNGDLLLYAAGAVISLYSHATFTLVVAACNVVVLVSLAFGALPRAAATDREARATQHVRVSAIVRWLAANVVVGMLWLPLLMAMLSIGRHGTGLSWIPPLSFRDLLVVASGLVAGPIARMRFPGIEVAALLLAVLAVTLWTTRMPRRAMAVLVAIPMLFVVLATVASIKQPILLPRILCWITLPLSVALAWAVVVPSKLRLAARVATLIAFGVGLYWQIALADGAKAPLRTVFGDTRTELMQADEVVLAPYTSAVLLAYYGPPLRQLVKWHDPAVTGIENEEMIEKLGIARRDVQQVANDIRAGKPVVLVSASPDARFMPLLMDQVPAPVRRVESTCNVVPLHGVKPPPCIAVYAWNTRSATMPGSAGNVGNAGKVGNIGNGSTQ